MHWGFDGQSTAQRERDTAAVPPAAADARRRAEPNSSASHEEDLLLIAAIAGRSELALKQLYEKYGGLLFAIAQRMIGDPGIAQEIVQDSFLRCWDRAETFVPERGSVHSWLVAIARNISIDAFRGRRFKARMREQDGPAIERVESAVDDPAERIARRMTIQSAMDQLPASQRDAIVLAFFGGLTQTQVSDLLDVPLGTIKSRIRDGMLKLRIQLEGPPKPHQFQNSPNAHDGRGHAPPTRH